MVHRLDRSPQSDGSSDEIAAPFDVQERAHPHSRPWRKDGETQDRHLVAPTRNDLIGRMSREPLGSTPHCRRRPRGERCQRETKRDGPCCCRHPRFWSWCSSRDARTQRRRTQAPTSQRLVGVGTDRRHRLASEFEGTTPESLVRMSKHSAGGMDARVRVSCATRCDRVSVMC